MTDIRVRFRPPGSSDTVPGVITFTARHVDGNRPVVDGQDIILGHPQSFDVPAEGATISLRPTGPGWYYAVQGRADGHSFSTNKLVPPTGPVDFESLVRFDPKAGLAYEPDPQWWSHLDVIDAGLLGTQADLHAARDSAEAARDAAGDYRDQLGSIVDQAVADGFPLAGDTNAGLMSAPHRIRVSRSPVTPQEYGAVGDGITDDTAAIQAAIDAGAAAGIETFIPGGRYWITSTIEIPSNTSLRGAGTGKTVIDAKGLGSTLTSSRTAFRSLGTVATSRAITTDVPKGSKTAEVTDASTHYAPGDRVLLSSDQIFHVTSNLRRGEIKRIESVTSTTVTFEDAAYDSYAAASGAKLQKLTMVRDITLQDFTLEGTDTDNMERGYYCYIGERIKVSGCEFNYLDFNSVNLRHVVDFRVTNNTFRNAQWGSNTPNYYGLVVENATQHGVFSSNHGTRCRHLFTTGYTQTVPGVARFIVVSNNVDTYSQSSSYDTHDGSEYVVITGNTSSHSAAHGINCRARETTITNNTLVNYADHGIHIREASERIIISGNRIRNGNPQNSIPIYIRRTYSHFDPRNIVVSDNVIDSPTTHSIFITNSHNITLANNILGSVNTSYAIRIHNSQNSRIAGNRTRGGTAGVFLQDCKGTIVSNNSLGENTYGVRMAETESGLQRDTLIVGNDFTEVTHATKIFNGLGARRVVGNLGVADSEVA